MTSFIWSLTKLEQLVNHPQASVQEWAVEKMAQLYPAEFTQRLSQFLQAPRAAIAETSLKYIGMQPRDDLLESLGRLFLTGTEATSALAMQTLGNWRRKEALEWMKQRILLDPPLKKDQIIAMIYTLGRILDEEAYHLLKQTEKAIQQKDSSHWDLYYASVLEHRRPADVEYLMGAVVDEELKEDRRRNALGLLLAQVDQRMNPSDVFFAIHPAVQKRMLERIDALPPSAGVKADLSEDLRRLVADLANDDATGAEALRETAERLGYDDLYEVTVCRAALKVLQDKPGKTPWHYGLRCVAASAILQELEKSSVSLPPPDADWRVKLSHLLRNNAMQPEDESLQREIVRSADAKELISALTACIEEQPESWGALKAIEMLGDLRAPEAAKTLLQVIKESPEDFFSKAAYAALLKIGLPAVPLMLEQLGGVSWADRFELLKVLAKLPTRQSVEAVVGKFPELYADNPEGSLVIAREFGVKEFLPFLQSEYRPGEWHVGRVIVHLCRINEMEPDRFKEIERDVQRGDAFLERTKRGWDRDNPAWPDAILLELSCKKCSKKYQYELREVHQHPHKRDDDAREQEDFTPYRHGIVIVDDVHCKNCRALNHFDLTPVSFAQITTESLKLLALQRMNRQPPAYYPFKLVQLDEKDGKPLTLLDVEKEHQSAVENFPSKPAVHLVAGKFYEYVKDYAAARKAYLQAVDLDARALEGIAGLARLDHAEGRRREALDWLESCYENLKRGNIYLAEDAAAFKKTVREKRMEFAREAGAKPEDKPVEIRFKVETSDYPKNKPCPCGSGKKYKLCCMK